MPSSKESLASWIAGVARGGGWTGRGASSVERGPEPPLLAGHEGTEMGALGSVVDLRAAGGAAISSSLPANRVRTITRGAPAHHEQRPFRSSVDTARASAGPSATARIESVATRLRPFRAGHGSLFFGDFLLGPEESYPPAGAESRRAAGTANNPRRRSREPKRQFVPTKEFITTERQLRAVSRRRRNCPRQRVRKRCTPAASVSRARRPLSHSRFRWAMASPMAKVVWCRSSLR